MDYADIFYNSMLFFLFLRTEILVMNSYFVDNSDPFDSSLACIQFKQILLVFFEGLNSDAFLGKKPSLILYGKGASL